MVIYLDAMSAKDLYEIIGSAFGFISLLLTILANLKRIKQEREAPTEKRFTGLDERIAKIEAWRRDIDKGFTTDNNDRWRDNANRWDTFTVFFKDQHALNQATIGTQLVILDRLLKDSDDEELKNAKNSLRSYLIKKEVTKP